MVSTITNINSQFAKLSIKNIKSCLSLHIVSALIKVSNPRNVVFMLFAYDLPILYYKGRVVVNVSHTIYLKDRGNYY